MKHNRGLLASLLFPLLAALVVAADFATKSLVRANMVLGQSIPPDGRFRLTHLTNTGSVFGLPIPSTFLMILTIIEIIAIIWVYFRYLSGSGALVRTGLGLVLGGAIGNLIDRIRFGQVTDFLDVRLWGDFHWPSFNIADASITVGVIILVLCVLTMAWQAQSASSDG
ncbi:MAG: signal peptidase II [Chloroflexota bacterium]